MKKSLCFIALFAFILIVGVLASSDYVYARDSEGNLVIIVDPGHGDDDPGALGNGVEEEDCNWTIALSLKAQLETYEGVKVYLTRGSSEWFSNTGRGRFGYLLGADLFVSCHINSSTDTSVCGVNVYSQVNAAFNEEGSKLAEMIAENVASLGLYNNGVSSRESDYDAGRDYYTALDEAARAGIMGVIIEHAFVSNTSDVEFLSLTSNLKQLGVQDALAIAEYYGLTKRTVSDGDEITLTRTYSAKFLVSESGGTFSSSKTAYVYVSDDGTITACRKGTAVITYISPSGDEESVTVTVPEVTTVGIAAGNLKTFYSSLTAYNSSYTLVKEIFSDGSACAVTDYTLGSVSAISDTSITSGSNAYGVLVTMGDYSCTMVLYIDANLDGAQASTSLLNSNSNLNSDILMYPDGEASYGESETETETQEETETETTAIVTTEATTINAKKEEAKKTELLENIVIGIISVFVCLTILILFRMYTVSKRRKRNRRLKKSKYID